jgi:hypothetical protein
MTTPQNGLGAHHGRRTCLSADLTIQTLQL